MPHIFRIAAVQLDFGKRHPEIVKDIKGFLNQAKKEGTSIVCFPEASLNAGPKKNETILKNIQDDCRSLSLSAILVGNMKEGGKTYNQAVYIDEKGHIAGKHRKVHICDPPKIQPGAGFEIIETRFCRIGIAICWDISHPEALYTMAKKGARIIFCPMYWHFERWSHEKDHKARENKLLQSLVLSRAFENLAYVVFCNAYNASQETLTQYSAIAEPHRILDEINDKPGMIRATVDLDYLERIRKRYKKEYSKHVSL